MTFQQLYYLSEAAKLGSINKAAQALFVSQSAISNSIIDLETEFSLKLLHRSSSGVSLTTEGSEFLSHARALITQVEYLQERYNHREVTNIKQLVVSSTNISFCTQTLIQVIQSFQDKNFRVTLKVYSPESLIDDIVNNRSELGVLLVTDVIKRYIDSLGGDRVQFHELCKLQPRICVRCGHPLTKLAEVSQEDFKGYPSLVMNHGEIPPVEYANGGKAASAGYPTQIIYANDRGSIDDILIGTDAYHISCGMDSPRNAHELCLLPIKSGNKKVRFGWIALKNKLISPEMQQFIEVLTGMVDDWMHSSTLDEYDPLTEPQ